MSKKYKNKKQSIFNTKLDIVIPVHQRFDLLQKCLISLPPALKEIPTNLILIDNASPKEEADLFYAQDFDGLLGANIRTSIIRNRENNGFPKTCNQGANYRNSPYLFMLNSDVILFEDSIVKMVDEMESDYSIGVVGMKLIFPVEDIGNLRPDIRPAGKLQHIGLASNIRGEIVHQFVGWNPDHPKVNAMRTVLAVTGAALMTRRDLWKQIGGFNEIYGRGTYEDVDYCLSVASLGKKVIVMPDAVGIHYTSATAEGYGLGYPLDFNRMTFMQRWGQKLPWTEWWAW